MFASPLPTVGRPTVRSEAAAARPHRDAIRAKERRGSPAANAEAAAFFWRRFRGPHLASAERCAALKPWFGFWSPGRKPSLSRGSHQRWSCACYATVFYFLEYRAHVMHNVGCMQIMLPESFFAVSEPPNRPETPHPDHSPGLAERSCGLESETPPPGPPPVVAAGDLALRVCSCGQGRAAVAGLRMTCYRRRRYSARFFGGVALHWKRRFWDCPSIYCTGIVEA